MAAASRQSIYPTQSQAWRTSQAIIFGLLGGQRSPLPTVISNRISDTFSDSPIWAHRSMASLADTPDLVGFFSYAREDDEGSGGRLSKLRDRIQEELRAQLGRTNRDF